MRLPINLNRTRRAFLATVLIAAVGGVWAEDNSITTAVYSQVGNGYKRVRQKNGQFKPEYYAIANGGMLPGTTRDHTVDRLTYPQVAGKMAEFLGRQNYFLAKDKKQAELLLVIHWGSTIPFADVNYSSAVNHAADAMSRMKEAGGGAGGVLDAGAGPFGTTDGAAGRAAEAEFENAMLLMQMENQERDRANEHNARLLGYIRDINEHNGIQRWAGGGHYYDDLVADIEEKRYYVVISAYDFREATEKNKLKLLWVTRVSVRSQGNSFDGQLTTMLASAQRYFGQESGRLMRQYVPDGRVEIGDAEVIGVADGPWRPKDPKKKESENK